MKITKNLTSHQLAAQLLEFPDVEVWVHVSERGYSDDLTIDADDIELVIVNNDSPKVRRWAR